MNILLSGAHEWVSYVNEHCGVFPGMVRRLRVLLDAHQLTTLLDTL